MNDFLKEVIDHARQHYTEEDRKKKERDSERLARWQRFKINYETFLVAASQLDGIKTLEQRKTEKHERIQGTIRLVAEYWESGEQNLRSSSLPVEPPWDRHYVIRLLIEVPDRPTIGFAAWLLQWKHEIQPDTKYALNDKCWYCFHRNEQGTLNEIKSDLVKRLRARIDMEEYMPGAAGASRLGLDL